MVPKDALIEYTSNGQGRTYSVIERIEDAHLLWRPAPGEFTTGELVIHILNARLMNLKAIQTGRIRYPGHVLAPGATAADVRRLALRTGKKTVAVLLDADLEAIIPNSAGPPFPAWRRVLGGLIEHETHHRSQLCSYLSALGAEPPGLFGLRVEDLPH